MFLPNDFFLPGVPSERVLDRLAKAGGNELASGKLASPESSAALAVNTFGWFLNQPGRIPPFSTPEQKYGNVIRVEVEYCARFPWSGGKHPWLDALVESEEAIIGVESKRFEPFRDRKHASFSEAYDRPVWGENMAPFQALRDLLRTQPELFQFLDAAQLVKHAFGLVTEARRKAKRPSLVYLFAEPVALTGRLIPDQTRKLHRQEVSMFANRVKGAEVTFAAVSYREWLATWPDADQELSAHRDALLQRYQP